MTATKKQIDVNDQAFKQTIAGFDRAYYGQFATDELETMRQFFDLNVEAQELGRKADAIKNEVELIESQIADARRQYNGLIAEGHTAKAMAAVEKIPSLRSRQEALKNQLPSIAERLDELEKAVGSIDHSKFLTLAKTAADDAEKARCRATSIFSKPSDIRRSISESRAKIK